MFKKAILAMSVAVAMGNASAVMITPDAASGAGGELFLFAADSSNLSGGAVAVFDLGLLRSDAGTTSAWAQGASGTVNGALSVTTYDFSSTTAWQSFAGAVTAPNRVYGVVAADNTTGSSPFASALFTSTNAASVTGVTTTRVNNSANLINGFQSAHNNYGTHATTPNGSDFVAAPATIEAATQITGLSGSSGLGRNPSTLVGNNQFFYQAVANSSSGIGAATISKYSYLGADSYFNLSNAGVLTWNVSAIPEPGEYAMLAVGLAMVGAIARRRRQAI